MSHTPRMTAPEGGLLIGDFARRCRLPVSTLRYYDQIGLLTPAVVDPGSGYRRYTLEQLDAAVLIARLRAIGTTPQTIATVLAGGARNETSSSTTPGGPTSEGSTSGTTCRSEER
jgi:DNA-binding transcriptional MerR regulator